MAIEPGPQFEDSSEDVQEPSDPYVRMTPNEIMKTHNLGDQYGSETGELISKKTPEEWMDMSFKAASQRPVGWRIWSPNPGFDGGLAQSMKKKGFDESKPIVVHMDHPSGKPTVIEGHHRLAVALNLAPDEPIPVMQLTGDEELAARRKITSSPRARYNSSRAYKKASRLADKTHARQLKNAGPNVFPGKCYSCGEPIEKGEGLIIRTAFEGPRGGRTESYHKDHLPEEAR